MECDDQGRYLTKNVYPSLEIYNLHTRSEFDENKLRFWKNGLQ